jgi:sensor histidine kinase YesM
MHNKLKIWKKYFECSMQAMLFLFLTPVLAQNNNTDSVAIIQKRPDDRMKVDILNDFSKRWRISGKYDTAQIFAESAKGIAENLGYNEGSFSASKHLYSLANANSDFPLALIHIGNALHIAELLRDTALIVEAKLGRGYIYENMNANAKAIELYFEVLRLINQTNNESAKFQVLGALASVYSQAGDIDQSNRYYLQCAEIKAKQNDLNALARIYSNIAGNFEDAGEYDTSVRYWLKAVDFYQRSGETMIMAYLLAKTGNIYRCVNNIDSALLYFDRSIKWHRTVHPASSSYAYANLCKAEIMLKNINKSEGKFKQYDSIVSRLNESAVFFNGHQSYKNLVRAYSALVEAHMAMKNDEMTNKYLKLFMQAKDSLNSKQQQTKVNELIVRYQVAENERQILVLKEEGQSMELLIFLLLWFFVLLAVLIGLFLAKRTLVYRNEKKHLEMVALRSQMNPHFIFNCLNSIGLFISKSQPTVASGYLVKFARLIRSILDNSQHSSVSLHEEIKAITLYLELEAMRLNGKFSFVIDVKNVSTTDIKIAPMIIQPFLENAIWHGIQHQKIHGTILISFELKDDFLVCIIEDNGVGRQRAQQIGKSMYPTGMRKNKSYGIQITKNRLELLSAKGIKPRLSIQDLGIDSSHSAGTRVQISVPYLKGN